MTAEPTLLRPAYRTAADWLRDLGDVPLARVRMTPMPGTATEADAVRVTETEHPCELVNGTLVEKAMGMPQAIVAALLIELMAPYARKRQLGLVVGSDGIYRMIHDNIREPDVAFTRRDRLPNPMPQVGGWCPDLCVEVISPGNTTAEMHLKRQEYFASGCQLVWEIDPRTRTAIVYTSADAGTSADTLDGGTVLPGFSLRLADLFAEFDAAMPPPQ
jgi:Uma2 family endonuclease